MVQAALDSAQPADELRSVAQRVMDKGVSQADLYSLFDTFRKRLSVGELAGYDDVLDTMDLLVGWCHPDHVLFGGQIDQNNDKT